MHSATKDSRAYRLSTLPGTSAEVPAAGRAAGRVLLHGNCEPDRQQPLRPAEVVAHLGPGQVPAVPLHPEAAHQSSAPVHRRPGRLSWHSVWVEGN